MARQPKPQRNSIISAVEIAYFRSFYKAYFYDLSNLNIFFGENDTGKSNVMRALNLFFNGEISDDYDFDFDVDFSRKRAAEAAGAEDVRKFAYVKVWFRTPGVHRQALGDEFYVKRTWSNTTIPDFREEYSRHITNNPGKQQSLTKFLNKIAFTYIPAVKDAKVYSKLLRLAYSAISRSDEFNVALRTFTNEIRNQTGALSERIRGSLGMDSEISPPTDLAELFASLDFQTLIAGGDQMSLIRQRGDGIQARHIPEILAFVAERGVKPYNIWGLEEPENSLSMNSAMLLSQRLREVSKGIGLQLFITTHSPAFYALEGDQVKKFFLRRSDQDVEFIDGSGKSKLDLLEFMGDGFYLPIVAESLADAAARERDLEAAIAELQGVVADAAKPLLFVEGDSEEIVVNFILGQLGVRAPEVTLVNLGGSTHAERLTTMTEKLVLQLLAGRTGFVLVDSDKAGRKALPNSISVEAAWNGWVRAPNGIYWRMLKPSAEALEAYEAAGIESASDAGVCLEDCYSAATRGTALVAGAYGLSKARDFVHTKADLLAVSTALTDGQHKYYLLTPEDGKKVRFANWLVRTGAAECDALATVLLDINPILTEAAAVGA